MLKKKYIDEEIAEIDVEPVAINIEYGQALQGNLYYAPGAPRATLVMHGATGAPAHFYDAFARWAAENRQVNVLTYDYRDFGKSATHHVKSSPATMGDWGVKDQSAALRYVLERFPNRPLWVMGHSLGGLCLSFHEEAKYVDRLIAVASGPAHITKHPVSFLPAAIAFWYIIGPLTTLPMGYLPGKTIGLGADIPAGVYWQWRRWCLSRGFHKIDWGKAVPQPDLYRFKGSLEIFGFEDDTSIPAKATKELVKFYPGADMTFRAIAPKEFNLKNIGHLGAFQRRNSILWPELLKV